MDTCCRYWVLTALSRKCNEARKRNFLILENVESKLRHIRGWSPIGYPSKHNMNSMFADWIILFVRFCCDVEYWPACPRDCCCRSSVLYSRRLSTCPKDTWITLLLISSFRFLLQLAAASLSISPGIGPGMYILFVLIFLSLCCGVCSLNSSIFSSNIVVALRPSELC